MPADAQSFLANPASWVSLAAVVLAGVSAFSAIRSSRAAREQARLAADAAKTAAARPELYLIDGYWKRASAAGQRIFAMYVRVTNPALSANTLLGADLRIRFRGVGSELTVPVPHATGSTSFCPRWESTALELPVVIPARGAVVGHLVFDDTGLVPPMARVESYQLVIRDVTSAETAIDIYILMEEQEDTPHGETSR
jgi:hypothetical protein